MSSSQHSTFTPDQLPSSEVKLNGANGTLSLDDKGDLVWQPVKGPRKFSILCFKKPGPQVIKSAHLVGASVESRNSVRFWYCQPTKASQHEADKAAKAASKPPKSLPNGREAMTPPTPKMVYTLKKTGRFQFSSLEEAENLATQTRKSCSWWGRSSPPSIVALVNPKSGRGKSTKIVNSTLLPMLRDAAGMNVHVHQTTGPGDATNIVKGLDLSTVDLLLCVGGDGTMYEGVQGMLGRPDWEAACRLPIAAVPTGSGNGMATSCGMWDPTTAAHAICKGRTEPLDMATVLQAPGSRYLIFLSVVFGLMANLDIGTEWMRWMGEARFTLGGLKEVILAKKYAMRVAYLPESSMLSLPAGGAADSARASEPPSNLKESLLPGSSSSELGIHIYSPSGGAQQVNSVIRGLAESYKLDSFPKGPPLPNLSQFPGGELPQYLPGAEGARQVLPTAWSMIPDEELFFFALYNPQYMATNARLNPNGVLNSGFWDMMYVSKLSGLSGRMKGVEMLLRADEGTHVELDYVKTDRVRAMVLQPLCEDTYMVLDGERVPITPLYLEVHPGLCNILVAPGFQEPVHTTAPSAV